MNKESLKIVLINRYNRNNWQDVIRDIFPNVTFFSEPFIIPVTKERLKDRIADFVQLGNVRLNDGKNIKIFELQLTDKINLTRNRVEMRNLIAEYIDMMDNHGVLAIFNSIDEDYRFTFTSKEAEITEAEGFVTKETDAKRYTYLLGPNESCRTAVDQLSEFSNIKNSAKIEDVIKAFSVEKLSKLFFNEYKEQYEKFVCYITGKRFVKKGGKWTEKEIHEPNKILETVFHNDEKETRDFIKKTLGRIVFLHFLQKKGWLGCPANSNKWGNGDKHFLHNYYYNCSDKEHFYSKYLVPLFFDCLNKERPNDVFEKTGSRIPYLNGGLFENKILKQKQINFPQTYWDGLFEFFAQFNFTIDENDPFEQEVGIDPEMLGHIFENLLEDNKDKGAFYTPKPIVEYMCKESLIQYLKTHLFTDNSPLQSSRCYAQTSERGGSEADGVCDLPLEGGTKGGLTEADTKQSVSFDSAQDDRNNSKIKALENFIRNHDYGDPESSENYIKNNARQIEQLLDDVKICDPAIGSGAFPMGLLQEIFWAKMTLDWTLNPAEVKKQIIQNSIYGVDIDSGAIDIARLRFWLSLIVDAEKPEPLPNLDYKIMQGNSLLESFEGIDLSKVMEDKLTVKTVIDGQQDLLDFANNDPQNQIVFSDDRKQKVQDLKDRYFSESDIETKKDIHKQIDEIVLEHIESCLEVHKDNLQLKISILKKELKGRIKGKDQATIDYVWNMTKKGKQLKQWKLEISEVDAKFTKLEHLQYSTDRPFFLWHLYFSEIFNPPKKGESSASAEQGVNGGFDIVIGNPPYVQFQKIKINFRNVLRKHKYYESQSDIWYFFVYHAKQILKNKGTLCYITSNYFLTATHAKTLRLFLGNQMIIMKIIDFADSKIFKSAGIHSSIILSLNESKKGLLNFEYFKPINKIKFRKIEEMERNFVNIKENSSNWILVNSFDNNIIQKVTKFEKLANICVIGTGIKSGFDKAFVISSDIVANEKIDFSILKKWIKNSEISRYYSHDPQRYIIYTHNNIKMSKYPNALHYLKQFETELKIKWKKRGEEKEFYKLYRAREYLFESGELLICPYKSKQCVFSLVNDITGSGDIYAIKPINSEINIKYILSILNSNLTFWLYPKIGKRKSNLLEFYTEPLSQIPVKKINDYKQQPFIKLVDQILLDKKAGKDTQKLEDKIDLMVYKLYELTYEEVKIVDPEFTLSEEEYENFKVE